MRLGDERQADAHIPPVVRPAVGVAGGGLQDDAVLLFHVLEHAVEVGVEVSLVGRDDGALPAVRGAVDDAAEVVHGTVLCSGAVEFGTKKVC